MRMTASDAKRWFGIGFVAWTAFAVLIALWGDLQQLYQGRHPAIVSGFFSTLLQQYTLGLATPLLVYAVHLVPPTRRPLALTLGAYVVSLVAACIVGMPLLALVSNTLLGKHFTLLTTLEEGLFSFLVYGVVLAIVVAVTQVQLANERLARALRLEADLSRLRVEALQRQIHPHFIFNTLNAVGAIMHTDVSAAEEMIAALADLLRTATDKSNDLVVPLREELMLVDRYALIMKLRYGDRLTVNVSAEPRALEVPFLTFMLQPLVENAIVHGLEETSAAITVDVSCRLGDDRLIIEVKDDGATVDTVTLREGVGIGNTRARLAELYGQRAMLSIGRCESQGTCLTLAVPTAPVI
jgi:two-component system, LytTR family, sensor kinase